MARYADRTEAGKHLAEAVAALGLPPPVVVLALPRGGVPVAAEVARRLGAPLDVVLVRKIGTPGHEELAAGAVAEGAEPVFNRNVLNMIGMEERDFRPAVAEKRAEITRRRQRYLEGRDSVGVEGASVVLVDDGIATGATVRAALSALRERGAARTVLAVPVAPPDVLPAMRDLADEVVCLETPEPFIAVGAHYANFPQTSDDEVVALLRGARPEGGAGTAGEN